MAGPFDWKSIWEGSFEEDVLRKQMENHCHIKRSTKMERIHLEANDSAHVENARNMGNICGTHNSDKIKWCNGCSAEMCPLCIIDMSHDNTHKVYPISTLHESAGQKVIAAKRDFSQLAINLTSMALRLNRLHDQPAINFFLSLKYDLEETHKYLPSEFRKAADSLPNEQHTSSRVRNLPDELKHQDSRLNRLTADEIMPMIGRINDKFLGSGNSLMKDYVQFRYWLEIMAAQLEVDSPGHAPIAILGLCSLVMAKLFASYQCNLQRTSFEPSTSCSSDSSCSGTSDNEYTNIGEPNPNCGTYLRLRPNVFYLDFEAKGDRLGKVIIETDPDAAPLMSANFAVLCSGTRGHSYKGCVVFQCWDKESIIAGDYENNDGTGGRSILNGEYFDPDETRLQPERGTVGMRRFKQRLHKRGKVSSQFRIILELKKGITAIFGRVLQGIEIVDFIAALGNEAGVPSKTVTVANCGKYS